MLNIYDAKFIGEDEFPMLKKQKKGFQIPFEMVRFSERKLASLNDAICFYEWDEKFITRLDDKHLEKIIPSLKSAGSVVQPDYSIYADEPLILQKWAVYQKNRVAVELQNAGLDVIPNLRWGDKRSFKFAFAGIPEGQVCSIGTYGQIKDKEKRDLFERGLEVALQMVKPKSILIYGAMPNDIFKPYQNFIEFNHYPSWQESAFQGAC